ncbi:hypothetical protein BVY03_04520 [bacterium K02(2017)]|nr:hypothetical protein BVY03_04520 [bacterium K02(2017)]
MGVPDLIQDQGTDANCSEVSLPCEVQYRQFVNGVCTCVTRTSNNVLIDTTPVDLNSLTSKANTSVVAPPPNVDPIGDNVAIPIATSPIVNIVENPITKINAQPIVIEDSKVVTNIISNPIDKTTRTPLGESNTTSSVLTTSKTEILTDELIVSEKILLETVDTKDFTARDYSKASVFNSSSLSFLQNGIAQKDNKIKSGGYFEIPVNDAVVDTKQLDAMTIASWLNPEPKSNSFQGWFSQTSTNGFVFHCAFDPDLRIACWDGSWVTSSFSLTPQQWNYVVVSYQCETSDNSCDLNFYKFDKDAPVVKDSSKRTNVFKTKESGGVANKSLTLATLSGSFRGYAPYDGLMEQVQIWNTALPEASIATDFNIAQIPANPDAIVQVTAVVELDVITGDGSSDTGGDSEGTNTINTNTQIGTIPTGNEDNTTTGTGGSGGDVATGLNNNNPLGGGTPTTGPVSLASGEFVALYDDGGNMTERRIGDQEHRYVYDGENHLREVWDIKADRKIVDLLYDYMGMRVKKVYYPVSGPEVTTYYIGKNMEVREQGGFTKRTVHISGSAGKVATISTVDNTEGRFLDVDANAYPNSNIAENTHAGPKAGTFYYLSDHLGSSQVMYQNINGVVSEVSRYVNSPFGELDRENSSGRDVVAHQYTGQKRDEEIGLNYYGARYYDPKFGRFTQPDLVTLCGGKCGDGFNRYVYSLNNPILFIDITGAAPELPKTSTSGVSQAIGNSANNSLNLRSDPQAKVSVARAITLRDKLQTYIKLGDKNHFSRTGKVDHKTLDILFNVVFKEASLFLLSTASVLFKGPAVSSNIKYQTKPTKPENIGKAFPNRKLPRNKHGESTPDPSDNHHFPKNGIEGPYSQLGTKKSSRSGNYQQAREFDANGKEVRTIDFTNHPHLRDHHTNPHQHKRTVNDTGGTPKREKHRAPPDYPYRIE